MRRLSQTEFAIPVTELYRLRNIELASVNLLGTLKDLASTNKLRAGEPPMIQIAAGHSYVRALLLSALEELHNTLEEPSPWRTR